MSPRAAVIWGARGHCRVLTDILRAAGTELAATADRATSEPPVPGIPLLTGWSAFRAWLSEREAAELGFLVAIGGGRGADRLEVAGWLAGLGLREMTLAHASAVAEPSAHIAPGCHLLAGSVLGAGARIGRQTILNTRASADHDCVLGEGVHLAPGATVCGEVSIGDRAFIATGATVLPKLTIGADAVIGAGAVVTRDVAPGATVIGVPAREVSA
ncbi:MAG: acetyltransferase [Pseudomonadota bacterium]